MITKVQLKRDIDIEVRLLRQKFLRAKETFEATVFNIHLNPQPVLNIQAAELKKAHNDYLLARVAQKIYEEEYKQHIVLCALLNQAGVKFKTDDNLNISIEQ